MSDTLLTTITINGIAHELPAPTIVSALTTLAIGADTAHVAVALNDVVVRRSQWDRCTLKHGDRVEIITAVAGG